MEFYDEYFTENERVPTKPGQFGYAGEKLADKVAAQLQFDEEYFT